MAEFEKNLIQERTKAGLEAARDRGRKDDKSKNLNKQKREVTIRLYNRQKNSVNEICEIMKVSLSILQLKNNPLL